VANLANLHLKYFIMLILQLLYDCWIELSDERMVERSKKVGTQGAPGALTASKLAVDLPGRDPSRAAEA
jgi:hypothetical protein